MIKNLKNREGFTMIELLIYTALIVIVVLIFTNFLTDIIHQATKIIAVKEVHQNNRFIIAKISQSLKTSKSITNCDNTLVEFINDLNEVQKFYPSGEDIFFDDNNVAGDDYRLNNNSVKILNFNCVQNQGVAEISYDMSAKKFTSLGGKYEINSVFKIIPRNTLY